MDFGFQWQPAPSPPLPPVLPAEPALQYAGFGPDPDVAVAACRSERGGAVFVAAQHGGGETALAHLSAGASRVVLAPLADAEVTAAVLDLKSAGIAALARLDYLRFVDLLRGDPEERGETYAALRDDLSPPHRLFWDLHLGVLKRGLFTSTAGYQLGRILRNLLRSNLTSAAYRALLYGDRETRLAVFDERIATSRFWLNALRLCALRSRLPEPARLHALAHGDPVRTLRRLVAAGLSTCPLWSRAFCNDAGALASLPAHLRPAGYARARAALDRLELRTDGPVAALLAMPGGAFDAFDLGCHFDNAGAGEVARGLVAVARTARPGARVLLASRGAALGPASWGSAFETDAAAERHLAEIDRAPVWGRYSVRVVR